MKGINRKIKSQLSIEDTIEEMSMIDIVRYYFPKITENSANGFLWECTCYPFSDEITVEQIYKRYKLMFESGII